MMNDDMKNAIESLEGYKKTLLKLIETTIQVTNSDDNYSIGLRNGLRICKLYIDGLEPEYEKCKPSAEPKRKKGKWNRLAYDTFNCLECGHTFVVMQGYSFMNFCPNCGSEMKKGEEYD